jgi:hypothetical protein
MRSSKKRSRSNQNRPRTLGNIINRVFDSSGPEGKVRGTPQQIIEKYQTLARDAQLSNDRVAAENFLQHAEHYTRMLAEAQREMAAEQEARQQQYQQQGGNPNGGQNGGHGGNPNGNRDYRDRDQRDRDDRRDRDFRDPGAEDQPMVVEVIDFEAPADIGLVETPEARPREDRFKGQRRDRDQRDGNREGKAEGNREGGNRDRRDRPARDPARETAREPETAARRESAAPAEPALPSFITGAAEAPAAETPAADKPRRAPRKPKAPADGKPEAAE